MWKSTNVKIDETSSFDFLHLTERIFIPHQKVIPGKCRMENCWKCWQGRAHVLVPRVENVKEKIFVRFFLVEILERKLNIFLWNMRKFLAFVCWWKELISIFREHEIEKSMKSAENVFIFFLLSHLKMLIWCHHVRWTIVWCPFQFFFFCPFWWILRFGLN
jgi:hypothetical protein